MNIGLQLHLTNYQGKIKSYFSYGVADAMTEVIANFPFIKHLLYVKEYSEHTHVLLHLILPATQ